MACGGFANFIKRSKILDPSTNILDSNGTLAIIITVKEEEAKPTPTAFVPKNPCSNMIKENFLDEETADVLFEVSSSEVNEGRTKKTKSSTSHNQILRICAPMLAALFESSDESGKIATASITDVNPDIFRHMLFYVYGGSVAEGELSTHAKEIIDAADRYSIVNLKLEAEAAYVKETDITMDNAMDNLLYADAKNCALLKEAVMDFLTENSEEASEKISFTTFLVI